VLLTTPRRSANLSFVTVQYGVIHSCVPCPVVLVTCSCGAFTVEIAGRRETPSNWLALDDGSHLCPRCADAVRTSGA
jgi:hypothetical protein